MGLVTPPPSDKLKAERLRRSLSAFVRDAWEVLEPETPLRWNWHLEAVCDALERVANGDCRRLIINIPPGSAKSLLVAVFFPAWRWLSAPGWRVLCASYARELSIRDSVRCRDLIESDWYTGIKKALGLEWELASDQNVKSHFQNDSKGFRMALSVGGATTGFRGDCTITDDPLNAKDDPTPEKLEEVYRWYRGVFWTRLNDQATGARIVIMQRLHENDLVGRLLRDTDADKWETLILPMRYDPARPDPKDPREDEGELLHPGLFPEEAVQELEIALGSYVASAQLQQDPVPSGGGIFNRSLFRFWYSGAAPEPVTWPDQTQAPQAPLPEDLSEAYQSWDCTFKEAASSDYVVGQEWRKAGAHRYLMRQWRAKAGFVKTLAAIREWTVDAPAAVYVEDKANGSAVIDSLKNEIVGIVPVQPEGGKESRANAVLPQLEAGQVWLPHPAQHPWVWELIKELLSFPKGQHDDQVDALTQALNRMRKHVIVI